MPQLKILDKKNEKYIFLYFFLLVTIFLVSTNKFWDFTSSFNNGFTDFSYYNEIAQCGSFFNLNLLKSINIPEHFAERWIPNFIIGVISNKLNIEILTTYRLVISILYILIFILIFESKYDLLSKVCYLIVIIFNPYTFRSFFAGGYNLNDALFYFSIILFVFAILDFKNMYLISIALLIGIISRQTSIFFIPISIAFSINKNISKKNAIYISIFTIIFLTIIKFSVILLFQPMKGSTLKHIYGIYIWLKDNPQFIDFYKFTNRFSFFLLLITPIFILKYNINNSLIYIITTIIIISQPFLAGPLITNTGGLRLFAFGLPFFCFPILENKQNKIETISFVLAILINSFHHKYSILNDKTIYFYITFSIFLIIISYKVFFRKNKL